MAPQQELAREVARVTVRKAEREVAFQMAMAALSEARADVAAAQVQLEQQMDTDRQRIASVPGAL
jgi:hypothetical protein